eukprot:4517598-Amphidinium_carterae.1
MWKDKGGNPKLSCRTTYMNSGGTCAVIAHTRSGRLHSTWVLVPGVSFALLSSKRSTTARCPDLEAA